MRLRATIREAIASAWSQPVASSLTILIVAGMVVTVMLTTGRTVAAENAVLASIDSAGTRSIVVRADAEAGLTTDILDRLADVEGIEWAGAFSSAVDATNTAFDDGTRVPVRTAFGADVAEMVPSPRAPGSVAYATDAALAELGMPDAAGSISLTTGEDVAVTGRLALPDFLAALEPAVLIPRDPGPSGEPVALLVVIADDPQLVTPVAEVVSAVLDADDPTKVSVQTSETLAELRELVRGQLGSFSRALVLVVMGVTAALVAVVLYGLVMLRRKDFGRRRALGATRAFIVLLLVAQTAALALVGVALGGIVAVVVLVASGDPLPGAAFITAVCTLAVAAATSAALVPAVVASRREPMHELRVP